MDIFLPIFITLVAIGLTIVFTCLVVCNETDYTTIKKLLDRNNLSYTDEVENDQYVARHTIKVNDVLFKFDKVGELGWLNPDVKSQDNK
jgi:hypothetical protein